MSTIWISIFVLSFFSAVMTMLIPPSDSLPLDQELLEDPLPPLVVRPDQMAVVALCWDGNGFSQRCSQYKGLIQQVLRRMANRLAESTLQLRESEDNFLDDGENDNLRMPKKKRRDQVSGFYSNW